VLDNNAVYGNAVAVIAVMSRRVLAGRVLSRPGLLGQATSNYLWIVTDPEVLLVVKVWLSIKLSMFALT
jgi:hypothetical protein